MTANENHAEPNGANRVCSRLAGIKDWEARARLSCYSVDDLAQSCRVSRRQLERYFLKRFGQRPHDWLHALCMRDAVEELRQDGLIKEAATRLGYESAAHFANDFKQYYGCAPSQFRA